MSKFPTLSQNASCAIFALALLSISSACGARVDCAPLDPRVSISKDYEGKASASAGTLFKLGKMSGEIGMKAQEVIQNLVQNAPQSEQYAIKLRALYLYCEIVGKSDQLTDERKMHMLNEMTILKGQAIPSTHASTTKFAKRPTRVRKDEHSADQAHTSRPTNGASATMENSQTPTDAVGYEVVGNNQGGVADEVLAGGDPNSVGRDISVCAKPGRSATGMRISQNGAGTAHRVIQNGAGTGERIILNIGGCPPAH